LIVHVVTKILVVAAAVLCIALAALSMAYAVNSDRIVAEHQRQVDLKIAAETARTLDASAAAEERTRLVQLRDQLSNELTKAMESVRSLQGERTELRNGVVKAEAERDAIGQKISQIAATAETQARLVEALIGEVSKLRDNELAYRRESIQLTDRINDLESQREVLEQSVRALQENLTELRLASQGIASGGVVSTSSTPRPPIVNVRGRIVQTMSDPATGGMLAQIDLGTNDQIHENTLLYLVREPNQYLGQLIILKADLKTAIGRIDFQGQKNIRVQQNDLVLGSLR
jgi:predicted nuclease with TOPRIM domain